MITPIVLLLCIILGSVLITRIGAIALEITGLSKQSSVFQARSAYTNCGFTTSEAEKVVNHPVRRHIVMALMFLGHLGVASVAGTILLTAMKFDSESWKTSAIQLSIGTVVLLFLATSKWINWITEKIIRWALRRFTKLKTLDYHGLMHLKDGYVVSEMNVKEEDWLANRSLRELLLSKEGVLILGIEKPDGKTYVGIPEGYHVIQPEDTLILYGHEERLKKLDERRKGWAGDQEHQLAVADKNEEEEKTNELLSDPG